MIRALAFLYLLTVGWSALRLGSVTIFDVASMALLPVLAVSWQERGSRQLANPALVRVAVLGGILIALGTMLSALVATAVVEHVIKGLLIAASLTVTAMNLALLLSTEALTPRQAVWAVFASAAVHSFVAILQDRLGLFMGLTGEVKLQDWMRATGLMNHPIEAGIFSAVGVVLGCFLLFEARRVSASGAAILAGTAMCLCSLTASASLTATLTLGAALAAQFVVSRKVALLSVLLPLAALGGVLLLGASQDNRLAERLQTLSRQGSAYGTVQARDDQIETAMRRITLRSFLVGLSFDPRTTPQGLDIHNGIVAMDYYFGVLGLTGQAGLIAYLAWRIRRQRWAPVQGAFLAVFVLFLAAYMTGPTYSRRSMWVPVLLFAAMPVLVRDPSSRSAGGGAVRRARPGGESLLTAGA